MTTTRILTRRRLVTPGAHHAPARRRRRTRGFVQVAGAVAAERLRLNSFGQAYMGVGAVLICILFYLALAAQVTQSSYDITRLEEQQSQLLAEQDQLRYQEVTQHAPAEVQQTAERSGMHRTSAHKFVSSQLVAIDLQAPIGAPPADTAPLWQKMVAAVVNRVVGAHDVMAATR